MEQIGGDGGDSGEAPEVEMEQGGGGRRRVEIPLVAALQFTIPPPLGRPARSYSVLNLDGTDKTEIRNRWRRTVLDYRLWCYNSSDARYQFGHAHRRCCSLPSKGHFLIYMHCQGKWLCAVIDGPSGYLYGFVTRSVGKKQDLRVRQINEKQKRIENAEKLPWDGGYESVKVTKCGDLVSSFMTMHAHVDGEEPAPLYSEVIRAGETLILHFTEAGKSDTLFLHNLFKNFKAGRPVGGKAILDARKWETYCEYVYTGLAIKDEEFDPSSKDARHTQKKRMATESDVTRAKEILKDVRLLHRPRHDKRGFFLLKNMPMQLSENGPVDPIWAENEIRESLNPDLGNENWEFLTEHFPEWTERNLVQNTYVNTEGIIGDKLVAYHESGHAIVALHTPGAQPIHKVTIVPQGSTLGMVSQVAEEGSACVSQRQIFARLDVCLGGRIAQELIFGEQSVRAGAEQDLVTARELAHNMVSNYWMSGSADPVHVEEESPSATAANQERINAEEAVSKLTEESYERVKLLLKKHVKQLEAVANALLEKGTLTADDILKIVDQCQAYNRGGEVENPIEEVPFSKSLEQL